VKNQNNTDIPILILDPVIPSACNLSTPYKGKNCSKGSFEWKLLDLTVITCVDWVSGGTAGSWRPETTFDVTGLIGTRYIKWLKSKTWMNTLLGNFVSYDWANSFHARRAGERGSVLRTLEKHSSFHI